MRLRGWVERRPVPLLQGNVLRRIPCTRALLFMRFPISSFLLLYASSYVSSPAAAASASPNDPKGQNGSAARERTFRCPWRGRGSQAADAPTADDAVPSTNECSRGLVCCLRRRSYAKETAFGCAAFVQRTAVEKRVLLRLMLADPPLLATGKGIDTLARPAERVPLARCQGRSASSRMWGRSRGDDKWRLTAL